MSAPPRINVTPYDDTTAFLDVAGNELADTGLARRPYQQQILSLPGRAVRFNTGIQALREVQVGSARPSYVNAILIQSRGVIAVPPCTNCRAGTGTRFKPFPACRTLAGQFNGACGNCKWPDHGARCSLTRPPRTITEVTTLDSDDEEEEEEEDKDKDKESEEEELESDDSGDDRDGDGDPEEENLESDDGGEEATTTVKEEESDVPYDENAEGSTASKPIQVDDD